MVPSVHIGNKNVLHSGVLILNNDETAYIEIRLPLNAVIYTDIIKIELRCRNSPQAEMQFSWETVGDVVRFELSRADSARLSGVSLREPAQFGFQDGRALFFQFAYSRVTSQNVVQYMVLQEEPRQ